MPNAEAVRAFEHAGWEQAAEGYIASFATATRLFIPGLLKAAGVGAGMAILDVACGPGFVAAEAARQGAMARGVDFSGAMLRVARGLQPDLSFDCADAEALPYADRSFDAVVSNFGIHHVPRPGMALREAYRVLRPGGRMAFTIWAAPEKNLAWRLVLDAIRRHGELEPKDVPAPGGGFRGAADCTAALVEAGFDDVDAECVGGVWRHSDGRGLLTALRSGTARMAALIRAQADTAIAAIVEDIDQHAMRFVENAGLAIPVAGFVASGRRS